MPKNRALLSLIAVPLIALLVACGGGDKDKSSSDDDSGSGSSSSSSPDSNSSSSDADVSLENCKQFTNLAALATSAFGGSTGSTTKLDKQALENLVKATPKEIRADMQIMADTFVAYFDALAKIGVDLNDPQAFSKLDATKIQQLEDATSKLDTPKFTAATEKVDAYFEKECS